MNNFMGDFFKSLGGTLDKLVDRVIPRSVNPSTREINPTPEQPRDIVKELEQETRIAFASEIAKLVGSSDQDKITALKNLLDKVVAEKNTVTEEDLRRNHPAGSGFSIGEITVGGKKIEFRLFVAQHKDGKLEVRSMIV